MSGYTLRTPSTILTTLIQDGQAAGSIVPVDARDLFASALSLPISSTVVTSGVSAYTYGVSDHGTLVQYNNAAAGTFTVPANIFQTFAVVGFRAIGAGQLTILAGAGFTLNIPSGLTATPAQWITGFVHFTSATTGVLM